MFYSSSAGKNHRPKCPYFYFLTSDFSMCHFWRQGETGSQPCCSRPGPCSARLADGGARADLDVRTTPRPRRLPRTALLCGSHCAECLTRSISPRFSPSSPKQVFHLHLDMRKLGLGEVQQLAGPLSQLLSGDTGRHPWPP